MHDINTRSPTADGANTRADLLHCADGLMSEHCAWGGLGHVTLEDVQIASADRGGVYANDDIGGIDDRWVIDVCPSRAVLVRGKREPSFQSPAVVDQKG